MKSSQPKQSRIFISYRRADSEAITGRIHDRLAEEFGRPKVFQDVESIPPGVNFKKYLEDMVATCDVLLVIIGQKWLTVTDAKGNRRLDNPNDFVAIEIEAGLKRSGMLVIPVLVDRASMPSAEDLPQQLVPLHYCNAISIRHNPDFNRDMDIFVQHLVEARPNLVQKAKSWRWPSILAVTILCLIMISIVAINRFAAHGSDPVETSTASVSSISTNTETATVEPSSTTPPTITQIPITPTDTITPSVEVTQEVIGVAITPQPDEPFTVKTSATFVNIYDVKRRNTIGLLGNGDAILLDPESLKDNDWIYIAKDGVEGWVHSASIGYNRIQAEATAECVVADGYDAPIGDAEARRLDQVWPPGWVDASPFGRLFFVGTPSEAYHTGADLNFGTAYEDKGLPVSAAASGVVVFAGRVSVWGNIVVIQHDPLLTCDGEILYGRYAHVQNMMVVTGQRVRRGEQIAEVGDAFGRYVPHLHFDLSRSIGIAMIPSYWPGNDLAGLTENFVDPLAFVRDHRP
jgi:murein DD-endopeptidase MepM/ murein hydrolase activator NlpD